MRLGDLMERIAYRTTMKGDTAFGNKLKEEYKAGTRWYAPGGLAKRRFANKAVNALGNKWTRAAEDYGIDPNKGSNFDRVAKSRMADLEMQDNPNGHATLGNPWLDAGEDLVYKKYKYDAKGGYIPPKQVPLNYLMYMGEIQRQAQQRGVTPEQVLQERMSIRDGWDYVNGK